MIKIIDYKTENALSVMHVVRHSKIKGGVNAPEHLADLFTQPQAQAAIISSMLYSPRLSKNYTPKELKKIQRKKV